VKMLCSPEVWTLAMIFRLRLSRLALELVIVGSLSASSSGVVSVASSDSAAGGPLLEVVCVVVGAGSLDPAAVLGLGRVATKANLTSKKWRRGPDAFSSSFSELLSLSDWAGAP
jgi:hypothetical protein